MSSIQPKIAAHVRSRRDAYVQHTLAATALQPAPAGATPLGQRDIEQMIDGFLALLNEALTTDSRDIRTFFLETVIPGLIQSGTPAPGIIGGVVGFAVFVSGDAAEGVGPEDRPAVSQWFSQFWSEYVTDMVRVSTEASK